MKTILIVLICLFAATAAQATTVIPEGDAVWILSDGYPSNWRSVGWSDQVLHTLPILERGLAPSQVKPGYVCAPASNRWIDGRTVLGYIATTQDRRGHKAWHKIRPGEVIEWLYGQATTTQYAGATWRVYSRTGSREIRCGNYTNVCDYYWQKVEVVTKTIEVLGPERIIEKEVEKPVWYEVKTTIDREVPVAFYQAPPEAPRPAVQAGQFWYYKTGWEDRIIPILANAAIRPAKFNINNSSESNSAASAAASSKSESNATNNNNIDIRLQQQQ